MSADPWNAHAAWWQAEFTDGADPEYVEQILPIIGTWLPAGGTMLDVGCGEGQVARLGAELGLEVIGVDPASSQASVAAQRAGGPQYLCASGAQLPFRDAVIDVAVACLVFEHIADLDRAMTEVARVVRPGGSFLLLLNHPLLQTPGSGWIDDQVLEPPEQYWRVGEYLTEAESLEQVEAGVFIRFFHRPLSRYLNGLRDVGFVLCEMLEPSPPPGFLKRAEEYEAAATIPRLMALRLRRSAPEANG